MHLWLLKQYVWGVFLLAVDTDTITKLQIQILYLEYKLQKFITYQLGILYVALQQSKTQNGIILYVNKVAWHSLAQYLANRQWRNKQSKITTAISSSWIYWLCLDDANPVSFEMVQGCMQLIHKSLSK